MSKETGLRYAIVSWQYDEYIFQLGRRYALSFPLSRESRCALRMQAEVAFAIGHYSYCW